MYFITITFIANQVTHTGLYKTYTSSRTHDSILGNRVAVNYILINRETKAQELLLTKTS